VIDGVPRAAPALLRAQRVTEKASRVGFDWNAVEGPLEKLDEELGELRQAIAAKERQAIEDELGDVLFTLVNVSRFLEVNAEDALSGAVRRFSSRFKAVEAELARAGRAMKGTPMEELDELWRKAKAAAGG
jgi:ATP diphosphatase